MVVVALLGGCGSIDTGTVARDSAARLLDCRPDDVSITAVGAYRYRGEGCGRDVIVACTSAALEPTCLRESALATAGGAAPAEEDEDGPPPFDEEPNAEVEARIRAGLEARKDDIFACTGLSRVGVRAAYAPDGSVSFSLQGELRESPEERCVEDALDGVRVVATGHAGVIVHLVR